MSVQGWKLALAKVSANLVGLVQIVNFLLAFSKSCDLSFIYVCLKKCFFYSVSVMAFCCFSNFTFFVVRDSKIHCILFVFLDSRCYCVPFFISTARRSEFHL